MPPNSHRESRRAAPDARRGIALVLVLGFLSILIIMAVGFSIAMRVERLVARTSLDHIKARQLGEAALARVIWDINENLGDDMVPDWGGDWIGGAFESVGSGAKVQQLIEGYMTNYVPGSLWSSATGAAVNAEWLPFDYVDQGQTRQVGRYAYLVLDCSGLLDANFDYSPTNNRTEIRQWGGSVLELKLTNALLAEVSSRWTNMIWGRIDANGQTVEKPWIRLETLPEINPLLAHGFGGATPLVTDTNSFNLGVYSRIPAGYLDAGGQVKQPLLILDPLNEGELETVFGAMGITDPASFVDNLVDYTDANNTPQNLQSICTEAVPMINEIVVSNSYSVNGAGTVYSNGYRVLVEAWYPFTTTNTANHTIRLAAQYQGAAPSPGNVNEVIPLTPPGGSWTLNDYVVVTSSLKWVTNGAPMALGGARVRATAQILEGGTPVDQAGVGGGLVEIDIGSVISGFGNFRLGKAANDPRINWNGSSSSQWSSVANPTLGGLNNNATYTAGSSDGHTLMYVANRPLKSVGELGLLLYDSSRPWRTISLLNGVNYFQVLDQFTLVTNQVRHGLINPNGYNTNVIATVFNQMPLERVPFDPGTTNFTLTQCQSLARRFAEKNIGFTNVSDLRSIAPQVAAAIPGLSNVVYESIVRNSAGLFAPRQQLFTVILVAQVQDEKLNMIAEQKGVGLVWRDPYPINGTHATLVRNFRWLTE